MTKNQSSRCCSLAWFWSYMTPIIVFFIPTYEGDQSTLLWKKSSSTGEDSDSDYFVKSRPKPRRSPRFRKRLHEPISDSDSANDSQYEIGTPTPGSLSHNGTIHPSRLRRAGSRQELLPLLKRPISALRNRKTLVLDLDETLVHSTSRGSRSHDFVVEVCLDQFICLYYVYKRPYTDLFLRKVSEWFQVVIFTASVPEYADPVIDWLDSSRTLISKRYFRKACVLLNGMYTKDLTVVEPNLSQVFLIDNAPISYALNQDNGIPISSWLDDPHDEALLDLLPFLDALRFADDVRSILSLRI